MSFKLSNTYLKLFIMTAAASAMLVGSECLHRLYFDIVPLGRPWEEFLYLLTFTSILCPLGVYQSLRRILSLPLLDRQSRSFRGLSELDQWDQLLLGPGRVVRGCQHWRLNDS